MPWFPHQKIECPICRTPLPYPREEDEEYQCCWMVWYAEEFEGKLYWTEGGLAQYDDEVR